MQSHKDPFGQEHARCGGRWAVLTGPARRNGEEHGTGEHDQATRQSVTPVQRDLAFRLLYPGVGYLALKTGVVVIPASIAWQEPKPQTLLRSLFTPGHAIVRYGAPLTFGRNPDPSHEEIRDATDRIMAAIYDSRQTTNGSRVSAQSSTKLSKHDR